MNTEPLKDETIVCYVGQFLHCNYHWCDTTDELDTKEDALKALKANVKHYGLGQHRVIERTKVIKEKVLNEYK